MKRLTISLALLALLVVASLVTFFRFTREDTTAAAQTSRGHAGDNSGAPIGALGRIEPGDGVVRLAARSLSGQPSIVSKLLVREGDSVTTGQVIGELDSTAQLQAQAQLAQARVDVARRRLEQVRTGAKSAESAAQQAEIDRVSIEVDHARRNLTRHERLIAARAIAEAEVDRVRADTEALEKQLRQARDRLASLSEIRQVDVDVARAELEASIRESERARTEHAASLVRSPLDGRIVKIHAWPGEEVGPDGILELARTEPMYVLAEVAEVDMARLKPGLRARMTGFGLPAPIEGTVETVGLRVREHSVVHLDPASFTETRIVEARIKLDDGAKVAHLIHLRVNVVIDLPSGSGARDGR